MDADLPPEKPAASPQAAPGGIQRTPSPWELDLEWQDAPRSVAKPRPPRAAKKTAPEPPPHPELEPDTEIGDELKPEPSAEIPPSAARVRRQIAAPILQRPHAIPRDSGGSGWSWMVIFCMGLLLFVFVAWQYLHDVPAGADDDLRPVQYLDQAPVIHGPTKIQRLLDSLVAPPTVGTPSAPTWDWDTPTLSRFFKGNGAALDNLRDLLEDADWHPAHAAWHQRDLGSDPRWASIFALKQAEGAYLARLGREEDAFVAVIDLAELAWRLEQLWAWPSFYSRALEAQERAAQSLAELLKKTRLPEPTLRRFQRQYSVCQPVSDALVQALNAFYLHEKKLILGPASGEPLDTMPGGTQLKRPGRLFFKPQATLQLFVDDFRQLKMEAQAPLANTGVISVSDSAALHQQGYQPNSAGESYCAGRMADYRSLPAKLGLARARSGILVALFAVRRYLAEQQKLPATLESLRPRFLLDVPVDPFSTGPLQYDIARGRIWSVGTDLRSVGGVPTTPSLHDPAEPTVEIGIGMAAAVAK